MREPRDQPNIILINCDDLGYGDLATDQPGANCRPVGVAANPKTLTAFDPAYPYICAEYDTDEAG